jgi:hypothetical protein
VSAQFLANAFRPGRYAKVVVDLDSGEYEIVGVRYGFLAAESLPDPVRYPTQCIFVTREEQVRADARETYEHGSYEEAKPLEYGMEPL